VPEEPEQPVTPPDAPADGDEATNTQGNEPQTGSGE